MTEHKPVVLVVDDERDHADGIVEALERLPVKALAVYTGEDAIEMVRRRRVDVVVTDLKLEGQADGLDVLREARQHSDSTQVILITAYATIENCKEAIKQGAFDYLVKPLDIDQLRTLVEQASRKAASADQGRTPSERNQERFLFEGIKGNSPAMQGIFEIVRRVAPTNIAAPINSTPRLPTCCTVRSVSKGPTSAPAVPPAVGAYIARHGLYGMGGDSR